MNLVRLSVFCCLLFSHSIFACDEEALRGFMAACVDASVPPTSADQKKGREWILEGRFCSNTDRVVDGFLLCQGHDFKAIGAAMACKPPAQLAIAMKVITDTDSRRPASCK